MSTAGRSDGAVGEDVETGVDSLLAAVARIPMRDDWTPPVEFDEYRVVRPLGRGGMGSVWLADDRLLDRQVAIKFIADAALDPAARERFVLEARAAARLTHPNVVTVHRFGEVDHRPYLVSEYLRGDALDVLPRPLPWETVLRLGTSLARGLAAVHRAGIVHRDIKPSNAIVVDGEAKLVDFGVAKVHVERAADVSSVPVASDAALTSPGVIAGTPLYLAPEVRAGDLATPRADVFQLGAVLYELLTGRAPRLDQPAPDAPVPSLHGRCESSRLATVVDRCLASAPADRYADGDELRAALELVIGAPIAAVPAGNPYRGLAAFGAEQRGLFFGRTGEIRAIVERLRDRAVVLVVGDSGVGKSSVCRAGVAPQISDGALADGRRWHTVELVPGQRPLAALAGALAAAFDLDEPRLATRLRDEPIALARELRRARGPGQGVLILIDQLEEVVTLAEPEEAAGLAAVIDHLASPAVKVLGTVRSDFLGRVAGVLGEHIASGLVLLPPLSRDGTRAAVLGPAQATGLRFATDEIVDELVGFAAELPLLGFTLAQLWAARDVATGTIGAEALGAIGGVRGALARHADAVVAALLPAQQVAARRLLLRLVTPARTRRRCVATELGDAVVLDALVQGRLVVARGGEVPTYELAHERLIDGWPTLAGWLSRASDALAIQARLAGAVDEWRRLGRGRQGLWSERQLEDVALLDELTPDEAAFVARSRRVVRGRRIAWRVAAVAVPALIVGFVVTARFVAHRDLERRVDRALARVDPELAAISTDDARAAELRRAAIAAFRAGGAEAEATWQQAREAVAALDGRYGAVARELESAFLLDRTRGDLRRRLVAVTEARIALAERDFRVGERTELISRLALYEPEDAERLTSPGRISVAVDPVGATSEISDGRRALAPVAPLAAGTYVVVASAPGRATVRTPVLVASGQTTAVRVALPAAAAVPPGFTYVPPGTVRYGSNDDEAVRHFQGAVPMYEAEVPAFLIGTNEVTYREWIEFLETLSPPERARRAPHVETSTTLANGALALKVVDGAWQLTMTPASLNYTARLGQPIHYPERTVRADQDWASMPVSGISADDAEAYAAWLRASGRVPGARLCTEVEWERAARGIDGRIFPNGDWLADANIDVTYGRREGAYGPDQVGIHPASDSPFGVHDLAGNVWELVRGADGGAWTRGGCFYVDAKTAHLANRNFVPHDLRHILIGLRMCADAPAAP